jgi:hypothetical protein
MLARYPHTALAAAAAASAHTSILLFGLLTAIYPPAVWLVVVELGLYLLVLLATGVQVARKKRARPDIRHPLSIATMHLSWGAAFCRVYWDGFR